MKETVLIFLVLQLFYLGGMDAVPPATAQQVLQDTSGQIWSTKAMGVNQNDLQSGLSLALFLNGSDPLYTSLIEDAFWVKLTQEGFRVAERSRIEKILAEEMIRRQDADNGKNRDLVTAMGIAKTAGAKCILTGDILADVVQYTISEDGDKVGKIASRLVVLGASLQLVQIQTERVLLGIVADFGTGKGFQEATSDLIRAMQDKIQR